MSLEAIERLLSQKIGVDPRIIGSRKISRALETRQAICGLSDLKAYFNLLQTSTQEFEELVEQIIVPETYFFRDRKPFDFLLNYVRTNWQPQSNLSKLHLLSVPCSSGEEPYSMAIALLEAGLPTYRFKIDAVDISKYAIAKAKRAVYGKNSFRGKPWIDQNRYFQSTAEGYELILPIRTIVNFQQGNLLNAFATTATKYDIIFCRNLLIYLEPNACTQVLNILDRLLLPKGLLFVGASETAKIPSDRFTPMRESFTFAYQKAESIQSQSPQPENTTTPEFEFSRNWHVSYNQPWPTEEPPTLEQPIPLPARASPPPNSKSPPPETINTPSSSGLTLAKELADTGQIEAAITHCQEYLTQDFTNDEAYTLLGTLHQSKSEYSQAEQYFRKALYLNPHSYEALMQLALLKEHRGDRIGAEILQQRIQKLNAPFS
ncbi:MAG TPA: chemotaxis protein CheR [Cyanobacteria bacterium UBA8803]|nr:chemotaxis protein CheR [Cyanobacteria bacterium UBA9273]HBL62507.1 chemotaxis protein CheR [Cyanobacteria bacterium UBA8803]